MVDASPGLGVRYFSASARVMPVNVVCAMPSSPPKVARPTMVTFTGSGVRSVVVSPTFRSPVFAAPRLMTTSPLLRGVRPSASWYALSSGSSIQFPARVGGPWPPMGLPWASTSWPAPWMFGAAAATPGTFARSSASEAATGRRVPWLSPGVVMTLPERTTASVPLLAPANIESKLARRVSPMTRVPARNATPSRTALNVPAKRRLWARSEVRLRRTEAFMTVHLQPLTGCRRMMWGR